MTKRQNVFIIGGPTASGKSCHALKLADNLKNGVIINGDAMQLYKGLPLLSAQPNQNDLKKIPHKLYSILGSDAPPSNLASWRALALKEIRAAHQINKIPILVGGTGLYLSSLLFKLANLPPISEKTRKAYQEKLKQKTPQEIHSELMNIDPVYANKIANKDSQRIQRAFEVYIETGKKFSDFHANEIEDYPDLYFKISLLLPEREALYKKANQRFLEMFENAALKNEVLETNQNYLAAHPIRKTLGFSELLAFYKDEISEKETLESIQMTTRRYAKRQYTWFRNQFKNLDNEIILQKPVIIEG